ncbi:hypothetical protein ACIA5C_03345 [Actinoplanes sp. NPDC051343]|uniref:phosphorylase family protein n=1 Tax=Actinoplanes sp. NPDC051343 TaxID=3363906 RepID=UPI00379C7BA7
MGSVDALVIAALPLEFDAARDVGKAAGVEWRPENADDRTPYLSGEYKTADGKQVTVALARPTEMGGRRTGTFVTTLANHLRPACLAMSGVCAGNPDDTAPGDVIVAAPAYEYDEGKQSGDTFQGAHQQYPLNDRWLRAAQDFDPAGLPSHGEATDDEAWALTDAGTAKITRILADDVDGPDRLPFAVMAGPFKEFAARASAEVLFALLGLLLPGQSGGRDAVPGPEAAAGKVPGAVKFDVIVRLNVDWPDLADLVGVPPYQRARFGPGDEPRGVWEWLEARGRLAELPSALVEIGRPELADLLRPYLMGGS